MPFLVGTGIDEAEEGREKRKKRGLGWGCGEITEREGSLGEVGARVAIYHDGGVTLATR